MTAEVGVCRPSVIHTRRRRRRTDALTQTPSSSPLPHHPRFCVELLQCVQAVRDYRATFESGGSSRRVAQAIFDEFMDHSAPSAVNLRYTIVDAVRERLDSADTLKPDLFDALDKAVKRLLMDDVLRRFVVSDVFSEALAERKASVELVSV